MIESKRGLDGLEDEAVPVLLALKIKNTIEENEQTNFDFSAIRWTRCDFNEVKEDPDACTRLTTLSAEGFQAAESPLEILLFMLPHRFWEHIAECSERKRVSIIAKESLATSRKDMKYMRRVITADRV